MIDQDLFLDIEGELVEQRGHIKKVSKAMRGRKRHRRGIWRQKASAEKTSREGNDTRRGRME